MSVSLASLHKNEIYHQDLKPSNVLVFRGGLENKLADFGRSHSSQIMSPIANLQVPGDPKYAPPEQIFAYAAADDRTRRVTGDLYLLGSMIFFLFTGNMLTPALVSRLAPEHRPFDRTSESGWRGRGIDLMPYLDLSFSEATADLRAALTTEVPASLRSRFLPETLALFTMLADPNWEKRGYRGPRLPLHRDPLSLERFVSAFARLSSAAAILGQRANG
jgi:serine/threonine protein kinase